MSLPKRDSLLRHHQVQGQIISNMQNNCRVCQATIKEIKKFSRGIFGGGAGIKDHHHPALNPLSIWIMNLSPPLWWNPFILSLSFFFPSPVFFFVQLFIINKTSLPIILLRPIQFILPFCAAHYPAPRNHVQYSVIRMHWRTVHAI